MTTALALPSLLPGELREQGMVIPPDLSFEAWETALRNAEWIERASSWWVVDLVAFGRAKFAEDYSQALPDAIEDADGFHQSKLRQAEWMADRWPASTRVTGQSYSAHRAVAKLSRLDAVALLNEKDKDGRRLPVRVLARRADEIEESILGRAVDATGACLAESEPLVWVPQVDDLEPDMRRTIEAQAPAGRHRLGWIAGALWTLVYEGHDEAFLPGRWRA